MAVHPIAKHIRGLIKHIPGAWVRVWKDLEDDSEHRHIWVGLVNARYRSEEREQLLSILRGAGFRAEMNGQHGSEGEFIIDVIKKSEVE
jgi:hypothetical protein